MVLVAKIASELPSTVESFIRNFRAVHHLRSRITTTMQYKNMLFNKKLLCLMFTLLALTASSSSSAAAADEIADGPLGQLRQKYESLSPKGKMAAGAAVGFVGSRLALKTVTKCAKIGAAAFITAEALKLTGVLDDLPALSEEQSDVIAKAKKHILRTTEDYRIHIRKTLSQEGLQNFFDNEKMAALGLAGGAVAGAIL